MKLNKKSVEQAKFVKKEILERRIITIHCRGTLDRMIELVKFPFLKTWTHKKYDKKTIFINSQYNNIRNYLINSGFLTVSFDGYRYHYKVNKK